MISFRWFLMFLFISACQSDYSKDIGPISQDEFDLMEFDYPDFEKDGWEEKKVEFTNLIKLDEANCGVNIKNVIEHHNATNTIKALPYGVCFRDKKNADSVFSLFPSEGTTHEQFFYVFSQEGELIDRYLRSTYK